MNRKHIYLNLLAGVLSVALLTSCSTNTLPDSDNSTLSTSGSSVNENSSNKTSTAKIESVSYDEEDYYAIWNNQNPNYIELSGSKITLKGSGALINGSKATINKAGTYVISGKLDNGQIIVDVPDKGKVRLVLNGAELSCFDNAPVYVLKAEKTIISLPDGTKNVLIDGKSYVLADQTSDEPNAAIFSKDDLVINGTGSLTVNANYNNGITSKDDLKITGGIIYIKSVDDGMMGKDRVAVKDGTITIDAGGDGIKATNDTDTSKGLIALQGGTYKITAGADAIQAESSVFVTGGKYNISTGGGSANSSDKAGNDKNGPWGKQQNSTASVNSEIDTQSAKGIKAAEIIISGGTFSMDTSDDSLHSNYNITIDGGDFTIASGDDGIHADSTITISNGKINITKSYEGIESAVITVTGGDISVTAKDDGINVAGGNDGSSMQGRPGQNTFKTSGNNKLTINGGYISVNATGDGLDSNGSIYMTGGTVVVSGPTDNGNGALDYDGVFEATGGLVIAAGSSGMAQAPSEQSTQNSILMSFSKVRQAGTLINLKDSKGNSIVTFSPAKNYQTVVISSPGLKKDETYTLYSGGTSTGTVSGGLYNDGIYEGGTKVVEFKISSAVTWLNESGVTTGGKNNPGGQNPGGQRPGMGGNQGKSGNGKL